MTVTVVQAEPADFDELARSLIGQIFSGMRPFDPGMLVPLGAPPYITERGLDLLNVTIGHVERHPEALEQGIWLRAPMLPTRRRTACLAGWACLIAGAEPAYDSVRERLGEPICDVWHGGARRHIPELATELLGLDRGIAARLFLARTNERTMAEIRDYVAMSREPGFTPLPARRRTPPAHVLQRIVTGLRLI